MNLTSTNHPSLTLNSCPLYRTEPESEENLSLMRVIDETYLAYPFFGGWQMTRWLQRQGHRVHRLMAARELEEIYRRPNLSRASNTHPVCPYLLSDLTVNRSNQVWATDLTYMPVKGGYVYLCAVIDWHSRYVLFWERKNTLDATFCMRAVAREMAFHGVPDIFNTATKAASLPARRFPSRFSQRGDGLSMNGDGRCPDNVMVERLWCTLKYEEVYLKRYEDVV
jgi:putative transposase